MAAIETHIPRVEEILGPWRDAVGADYPGYRNHVYRVIHFALTLGGLAGSEKEKVVVAACFHDLEIWSDRTFDYLAPSVALARAYLDEHGLAAWAPEIEAMIDQHHKLRRVRNPDRPLVETFRRADLVDVSLGAVRFGLPRGYVREVRRRFPDAGFHRTLLRLAAGRFRRHPTDPLPMLRW
jgi:predicted metal-dependent HD superfamily phosphohydrolase